MSDPTLPPRFKLPASLCLLKLPGVTSRSAEGFRLRRTDLREQPSAVLGYVGQVRLRQTNPYGQLPAILGYVGQDVRQASTSLSF